MKTKKVKYLGFLAKMNSLSSKFRNDKPCIKEMHPFLGDFASKLLSDWFELIVQFGDIHWEYIDSSFNYSDPKYPKYYENKFLLYVHVFCLINWGESPLSHAEINFREQKDMGMYNSGGIRDLMRQDDVEILSYENSCLKVIHWLDKNKLCEQLMINYQYHCSYLREQSIRKKLKNEN